MNKRQRRIKRMKNRLTEQERAILEALRQSTNVIFYKHNCTKAEAQKFVQGNGIPKLSVFDEFSVYKIEKGKFELIAFFDNESVTDYENSN